MSARAVSNVSDTACPQAVVLTPDGGRGYVNYQCAPSPGVSGHDPVRVFNVATGTFLAPIAFFSIEYPAFQALQHNSSDWRALAPDKQLHFVVSAQVSGVLTSALVSLPSTVPAWKIAGVSIFPPAKDP